jgi:hypothetical protein
MMEEQMLLDINTVRIEMRALHIRYNFTSIFYVQPSGKTLKVKPLAFALKSSSSPRQRSERPTRLLGPWNMLRESTFCTQVPATSATATKLQIPA